jgi:hypothetical protein
MAKKKAGKAKRGKGLQSIMVDLDVHKTIEARRQSFEESPNAILRRILGLDKVEETRAIDEQAASDQAPDGWLFVDQEGRATLLPSGTELRAVYRGLTVSGPITGDAWEIGDRRFRLPPRAVSASDSPGLDALDGWQRWEVRLPGAEAWHPLIALPEDVHASNMDRRAA